MESERERERETDREIYIHIKLDYLLNTFPQQTIFPTKPLQRTSKPATRARTFKNKAI